MTTATLVAGNRTVETEMVRPRRSLEELVEQLFAAMGFGDEPETVEHTATRSIHEARRLRQAGDVDTALGVLGSVDAGKATPREARWAFSEWAQLVKRRPARRPGCRPGRRAGRCASAPRRRDAGGRGGSGDALAAWEGRLGAQPPGAAAPGRRCVMVVANVDIPALKARHPLGDVVEAAGVRLHGRGRVRQGVCPFHDEAESRACTQGRSSSSRSAADAGRRAGSPEPRPADGGGALLRRSSPAFDRSAAYNGNSLSAVSAIAGSLTPSTEGVEPWPGQRSGIAT